MTFFYGILWIGWSLQPRYNTIARPSWGDNTNRVCRATYGNDHEEWGEWRAIGNNDDTWAL